MATEIWVLRGEKFCDLIERDITLREKRLYPAENLPDTIGYRVVQCECSAAIDCNLAGIPCQHAFTNPTVDQFILQ